MGGGGGAGRLDLQIREAAHRVSPLCVAWCHYPLVFVTAAGGLVKSTPSVFDNGIGPPRSSAAAPRRRQVEG